MKVHRGKTHKYLGMSLDFSHKGQCRVTMHDYIDGILKAYDLAIKDHNDGYEVVGKHRSKVSVAPDNLFVINETVRSYPMWWQQLFTLLWQKHYMSPKELGLILV